MGRKLYSAAVLTLLVASQVAAWTHEGCYDEIVGESGAFGVVGEMKPTEEVDQTDYWRDHGAISKLNLYYSWNYGCLQGIKATYGYKAKDAKIIGHEKNLYTQDLKLADYEHVNKFDVVRQPNKCIEFLKLYTTKGQTLAFGNAKSTSPMETVIAPAGAFLAALKGVSDVVDGKQEGLQSLKFIWAREVCPSAAPVPKPETPPPAEGTTPVPPPAPEPTPEPTPEAPAQPPAGGPADGNPTVCPAIPAQCDETATEGTVGYCPVVNPFTAPKCNGGCCISTGKCKMPLCKFNGLGADVIALDFICYGKNNGPFAGFNKCKNLACKLAVPGCQSGLLGGNCVGAVEAVNDEIDDAAKQYIGMPCLEIINTPGPLHMPLNKPGLPVPNGEYMGGLWSVCDCTANPSPLLPAIPFFDIKKHLLAKKFEFFKNILEGIASVATGDNKPECLGPLCALLPQLPVMNATLPDLQIPMALLANITSLLKPKPLDLPALGGMIPQIELPHIETKTFQLTLPDLPTFEECVHYFVNITNTLKPAVEAVLQTAEPLSIPDCVKIVSSLLPEIRFHLPQLDITNMPKLQLPDLTSLVGALLPKIPDFPHIKLNMPGLKLPKFGGNFTFNMPKIGEGFGLDLKG